MTGQDLLDRMELLNEELQLQVGEANVVRGLLALNVAQDYFESVAASRPNILGSSTGTVVTAANTETTLFPLGLLRLDRLHLLDANGKVVGELTKLHRTGGHASNANWPLSLTTSTSGKPTAYWTNGLNIYWSPLPSGMSTVRWYGFSAASNITASSTLTYPDIIAMPLAGFAAAIYKGGVDDDPKDVGGLAQNAFGSALDALALFNRDGARGLEYTEVHST